MKEVPITLIEFLKENPKISSLVVSGIYPLSEVTVFLQNERISYTMYLSNRESPARYLNDEIERLPSAYRDRIRFDPLNLNIIKGTSIKDKDVAILYIDDFIRKRLNERVQR